MLMETKNVCVAVQARSTSERLPRKIHRIIDGKPVLSHIMYEAYRSEMYINMHTRKHGISVKPVILTAHGDELIDLYKNRYTVYEGDEHDVLSRYAECVRREECHYIVRITADCPMLQSYMITKAIKAAVINNYDYVGNVDPECRTVIDGMDVEVISSNLMNWLDENVTDKRQREHVTLALFEDGFPSWCAKGLRGLIHRPSAEGKCSIDTEEDFKWVKSQMELNTRKFNYAVEKYGKAHVHRF